MKPSVTIFLNLRVLKLANLILTNYILSKYKFSTWKCRRVPSEVTHFWVVTFSWWPHMGQAAAMVSPPYSQLYWASWPAINTVATSLITVWCCHPPVTSEIIKFYTYVWPLLNPRDHITTAVGYSYAHWTGKCALTNFHPKWSSMS